jgi:TetR/AcrR family transcriptional repressor of nem operon
VGKSPAQAVERIVSAYLEQSQVREKPYLRPLAMLGAKLSHSDPQVREVAINGFQRIVQLIAGRLTHRTSAKTA